jgi:hypothetical protein
MSFIFMMAAVLVVILAAGCTSAPVKETSTTNVSTTVSQAAVRYVELQFSDGTKAGGKYVSETPGFVTIVPMYVIDEYGFMKAGGDLAGKEVGMKTDLITTMVNIDDPSSYVSSTLKAQSDKAAADKIEQDKKTEMYRIQAEQIAAEQAKRQPTKRA